MATAIVDWLGNPPTLTMRGGVAYELKATYLVTGLTNTDHTVFTQILAATNLPEDLAVHTTFQNLLVVDKQIKLLPKSPDKAEVEVTWQRRRKVVFQDIGTGESSSFVLTFSGSLQEIETPFDADGTQISLEHTYGASDPDFPSETITQGGTVRRQIPQAVASFKGAIYHLYPDVYRRAYLGYVNSVAWFGDVAGQWLCVNVNYEQLDSSTIIPRWAFTFEFQWSPLGWDEYAYFIDSRTNIPADSLVLNTGYKLVTTYSRTDFNVLFAV